MSAQGNTEWSRWSLIVLVSIAVVSVVISVGLYQLGRVHERALSRRFIKQLADFAVDHDQRLPAGWTELYEWTWARPKEVHWDDGVLEKRFIIAWGARVDDGAERQLITVLPSHLKGYEQTLNWSLRGRFVVRKAE